MLWIFSIYGSIFLTLFCFFPPKDISRKLLRCFVSPASALIDAHFIKTILHFSKSVKRGTLFPITISCSPSLNEVILISRYNYVLSLAKASTSGPPSTPKIPDIYIADVDVHIEELDLILSADVGNRLESASFKLYPLHVFNRNDSNEKGIFSFFPIFHDFFSRYFLCCSTT